MPQGNARGGKHPTSNSHQGAAEEPGAEYGRASIYHSLCLLQVHVIGSDSKVLTWLLELARPCLSRTAAYSHFPETSNAADLQRRRPTR